MDFDHIKVRGVNCETATAVPVVSISTLIAGGGDRLDVDVTQLPSNGPALRVNASTTTVRSVQLRVANPIDGCTTGALDVSGATVASARVEGLRASYGSNVFAVWVNTSGAITELMVSDCEVGGSGSRVVAHQATLGRVMMNNIRHSSGYCVYEQNASANASMVVMMSNVRANSLTSLARFEKATTFLTSNVQVPSGGVSGSVIYANGASTVVTWSGDAVYTGNTESSLIGGATISKVASAIV
jgi:hypothetical protein